MIHPELEGGIEIVRHTLLRLGLPLQEINRYTDAVRQYHYNLPIDTEVEHRLLYDLLNVTSNIEVTWLQVYTGNQVVGHTLAEANLRVRTGASVVAILRNKKLLANPKSMTVFQIGDRVGFIGDKDQIEAAANIFTIPEKKEVTKKTIIEKWVDFLNNAVNYLGYSIVDYVHNRTTILLSAGVLMLDHCRSWR